MIELVLKSATLGNSLAVQWLGLHVFTAEGAGSVPGWGIKIPQAAWWPKREKKKKKRKKSATFPKFLISSDCTFPLPQIRQTQNLWLVLFLHHTSLVVILPNGVHYCPCTKFLTVPILACGRTTSGSSIFTGLSVYADLIPFLVSAKAQLD